MSVKKNIKNSSKNILKKCLKGILFAFLLMFFVLGFDVRLKVVTYKIDVENLKQPLRIALIADLHSCNYGAKQERLLDAIDQENPDLILLVGDIFDEKMPDRKSVV